MLATLSACATFRSYNAELTDTVNLAARSDVDGAIKRLEHNNRMGRKDLLQKRALAAGSAWSDADSAVPDLDRAKRMF